VGLAPTPDNSLTAVSGYYFFRKLRLRTEPGMCKPFYICANQFYCG
jgi:hypothetical protein